MITAIKSGPLIEVYKDNRGDITGGPRRKARASVGLFSDPAEIKRISYARSKKILRRLVAGNYVHGQTTFLTLTFGGPKRKKYADYQTAAAAIVPFFQRLSYRVLSSKRNKFRYVLVPERHKDGVFHFHAILFGVPFLSSDIVRKAWGHGFIKLNCIFNDCRHAANYLVKYFTKDTHHYLIGKRRYFRSRNLRAPIKYRGEVAVLNVLNLFEPVPFFEAQNIELGFYYGLYYLDKAPPEFDIVPVDL